MLHSFTVSRRTTNSTKGGASRSTRSSARAGFRTPGVLVVRHGLSVWNAEQRWQGWADIDLAPEGIEQAANAARELRSWPRSIPLRLVVSDLVRTHQTAAPMQEELELGAPRIDPDFRERGVGEWSGKTTEEIEAIWPGMLENWRNGVLSQLPGGEDEDAFRERISRGLRRACEEAAADGCTIIVVSHGGVIRTLERLHHVEPKPVGNLGGRWFFLVGGEVRGGSRVNLHGPGGSTGRAQRGTVL